MNLTNEIKRESLHITREMKDLKEQLVASAKIISNKDEMINIQEKSLKLHERRFGELKARTKSLQELLTTKEQEITELNSAIKGPSKLSKRQVKTTQTPILEQTSLVTIENLKLDLSVAKSLYKECYRQSVKQEQTIDLLRQAYLDFRIREYEYITEIDLLKTSLKGTYKQIDDCHHALNEIEDMKHEIRSCLKDCKRMNNGNMYIDLAVDDLEDMKYQLNFLQDLLKDHNETAESNSDDKVMEMKRKIYELQEANQSLLQRMTELNQTLNEKEIEVKALRKILTTDTLEIDRLCKERDENKGALVLMHAHSGELKTEMTVSQQRLRATQREIFRSRKSCLALKKKLKKNRCFVKVQQRQMILLKSRCKKIDLRVKDLTTDYNQAVRCVQGLRVETSHLANQVYHWQSVAGECEERNNSLMMDIDVLRTSIKTYSSGSKDDTMPWSDLEYLEAIESGTKICAESKILTKGVREWIDRMRVERDLMSSTIKSLKRKNRQLASRLRASDCGLPPLRSGSSEADSRSSLDPGDPPCADSATRLRTVASAGGNFAQHQVPQLYAGFCQLITPVSHPQHCWDGNPYMLPTAAPHYPARSPQKSYTWRQYSDTN